MAKKFLWAVAVALAACVSAGFGEEINLGYSVTLVGGPNVENSKRTCWPLTWGWPNPSKGAKMEWVDDPAHYEFALSVYSPPLSPSWQRYHWVGAGYKWADLKDNIYVGEYANAPVTPIYLHFTPSPPEPYEEPVYTAGPGYVRVFVYFGGPLDHGQSGLSYCVSMDRYGFLNFADYAGSALAYNPSGTPGIGRCDVSTTVIGTFYFGAVVSTALYAYDVHVLPPELQDTKNRYIVWSGPVTPSADKYNPTVVFLDATKEIQP